LSIVTELSQTKDVYAQAAERKWVLPCICSENLTTTEAILDATQDYAATHGIPDMPCIIAITCNYSHRNQASNYTATRDWKTGLKLFVNDIKTLAGQDGPYKDLRVMIHLDHIQHDTDIELLNGNLSDFASIMYDASSLPFEQNIEKTARFVERRGKEILIEGACDEIIDAGGQTHNELTTPENAKRYITETGVDLIVANLGTEHRASAKDLKYDGQAARRIKEQIGTKIVLHGASSVPNDQIKNLFADGICKVNIWTALERDSTPALFYHMVKNSVKVAGINCVERLIQEGLLTPKCIDDKKADLKYFTTVYRQDIIFNEMKQIVKAYYNLWYR